jgi:hypothetical protein
VCRGRRRYGNAGEGDCYCYCKLSCATPEKVSASGGRGGKVKQ